ncbi:MAG TPA: hypothetical protein VM900_12190 [Sphingomonas sp.]|jgi:hypothetical protein|nr:hypothetical protein [Sphingomonas sp.]
MAQEDHDERRLGGDRRETSDPSYDGLERRIGDRRPQGSGPGLPNDPHVLSDIDLSRAYHAAVARSAGDEADMLAAEAATRGLTF